MGERKVLNKYYPPDFDPAKLPRNKRGKTNEMKVRMMLPMSVRCKTCGTFMYKGTKFNTRKEDVVGETYLGIQIIRFYYRCSNCAAEFTMVTDPKNSDYRLEHGASRNYEPWRAEDVEKEAAAKKKEEEEEGNVMKALENKTIERKRELDIMAALDEMKSLKARHGTVTTEQALEALLKEGQQEVQEEEPLPDEDEAAIRRFMLQQRQQLTKRLDDDDDDAEGDGGTGSQPGPSARVGTSAAAGPSSRPVLGESTSSAAPKSHAQPTGLGVRVMFKPKRKREEEAAPPVQQPPSEPPEEPAGLLGLGEYSSSESDKS